MDSLLYDELVAFYPLLDPLEDHENEAEELGSVLLDSVLLDSVLLGSVSLDAGRGGSTLLELGAGAGHGAHFVKRRFAHTTLTDLSEPMLARSRTLNPDCEHLVGDMRSLRLARTFGCVLVHDAVCYMVDREELAAMFATAYAHLRPGGAALFVPDCTAESFVDCHEAHAADDATRSLRSIAWSHDPDPDDERHVTDYAFLLREDGQVRAVHDRHDYGLFAEATWLELGRAAGFEMDVVRRPLPPDLAGSAYTDTMFLGRRR